MNPKTSFSTIEIKNFVSFILIREHFYCGFEWQIRGINGVISPNYTLSLCFSNNSAVFQA